MTEKAARRQAVQPCPNVRRADRKISSLPVGGGPSHSVPVLPIDGDSKLKQGHQRLDVGDVARPILAIDTGAFRSGVLKVLTLENDQQHVLQARADERGVSGERPPIPAGCSRVLTGSQSKAAVHEDCDGGFGLCRARVGRVLCRFRT